MDVILLIIFQFICIKKKIVLNNTSNQYFNIWGQHPKQTVKFEHKITFFFNCISKFGKLSAFKINKITFIQKCDFQTECQIDLDMTQIQNNSQAKVGQISPFLQKDILTIISTLSYPNCKIITCIPPLQYCNYRISKQNKIKGRIIYDDGVILNLTKSKITCIGIP